MTWTEATNNAGFLPRAGHQVVTYNNRLWVIGGRHGLSPFKNDVWWSEDGVTWTEATNNAGFLPRVGHQVVTYNNRLWAIGGSDGGGRYNDVWRSEDGVNWRLGFNDVFRPAIAAIVTCVDRIHSGGNSGCRSFIVAQSAHDRRLVTGGRFLWAGHGSTANTGPVGEPRCGHRA